MHCIWVSMAFVLGCRIYIQCASYAIMQYFFNAWMSRGKRSHPNTIFEGVFRISPTTNLLSLIYHDWVTTLYFLKQILCESHS
jgi:hypothetical protein